MSAYTRSLPVLLVVAALVACSEAPTEPSDEIILPALSTAGLGSWTTRAPMPSPRAYSAAAVVRNAAGHYVLYTIGGRNLGNIAMQRVEAYDPATNSWSRKALLPAKRSWTNGAADINGKIYVTGGISLTEFATKTLYVYNPASDSWVRKADMPVASARGVTGAIGGKLYVLTGGRLYRYDPATNKWTRLADALEEHTGGIGGVIGGKFYVAYGEQRSAATSGGSVDVYDPATNRWTTRLRIPYRRLRSPSLDVLEGTVVDAAGALLDGELYLIGGRHATEGPGPQQSRWVFAYNPVANAWTRKADIPTTREGAVARKALGAGGKSQIVVAGGLFRDQDPEGDPTFVAETEAFIP
jgi:N-acetylneuraminic acid mutarotase